MEIRFATADDSTDLLRIYNQYIDTTITFEYVLPTEEEFAKRISDVSKNYPYLICEENGEVVGYAYAHRHMVREAYQWNAELTIYLDKSYRSKGLGKKMYNILIEILKLQGIKTVYSSVTVSNEKSKKLHESLGFSSIGIYQNAGYKCGKWNDVQWFEKSIGSYDLEPVPFISISKISKEKIDSIIKEYI